MAEQSTHDTMTHARTSAPTQCTYLLKVATPRKLTKVMSISSCSALPRGVQVKGREEEV